MSWKKAAKVIIFLVYTWFIVNSPLFAMGIVFFERATPEYRWNCFVFIFCQSNIIGEFFTFPWFWPGIMLALLVIGMEIAILFYPVRLWWRKRTFFRAWVLAMAGALMPNYIYIFYGKIQNTSIPVSSS